MHGLLIHGRLRAAFKAGFTTLLLGLLCTAPFAAPKLAAEQGFAHTHPHGTEHHLHAFKLIFGNGVTPARVVAVSLTRLVSRTRHFPQLPWVSVATITRHHSRAPPTQRSAGTEL